MICHFAAAVAAVRTCDSFSKALDVSQWVEGGRLGQLYSFSTQPVININLTGSHIHIAPPTASVDMTMPGYAGPSLQGHHFPITCSR
jgi:hypothetical protein